MNQKNMEGAGALPVLPGIDVALGLTHVGNNKAFYFQLLERFRLPQRLTISEFQRECGANLHLEARRRIHSLRGVAANIGAFELEKVAGNLEAYLKNNGSYNVRHPDLQKHIKTVEAALIIVLDGLDQYHEATKVEPEVVNTREVAQTSLAELRVLLQEDRADAVFYFDTIRASLAELFDEATLTQVAAMIRQFNFVQALRLLRTE